MGFLHFIYESALAKAAREGKNVFVKIGGPLGNIGFPTGKDEGIEHFITMLKKSRKKLTAEDLMMLRKSLRDLVPFPNRDFFVSLANQFHKAA